MLWFLTIAGTGALIYATIKGLTAVRRWALYRRERRPVDLIDDLVEQWKKELNGE